MRLSTKGRYAVTAVMDLHLHAGKSPVTLADISERQSLSLSYLEQLFSQIRRHGLVRGVRGPGGGYRLARPAETISVADIILAVDQSMDWEEGERCVTHDLWAELSDQIQGFLEEITLASLASEPTLQALVEPPRGEAMAPGAQGRA